MRIAVIDDEKLTREELIRLIREDFPQAEVYEAGSGVQAMQLLEKKPLTSCLSTSAWETWRGRRWPPWPGG